MPGEFYVGGVALLGYAGYGYQFAMGGGDAKRSFSSSTVRDEALKRVHA
jgi:hypothetical protein